MPALRIELADGVVVGDIDEQHILEDATKSKTGLTRLFCFGIGTDVNTHLLDKIAEETKAFSTYVRESEDIEAKVSSLYSKISNPVLANLKLTIGDGVPRNFAEPASARNSRSRENHATIIDARIPSTICATMTVMK